MLLKEKYLSEKKKKFEIKKFTLQQEKDKILRQIDTVLKKINSKNKEDLVVTTKGKKALKIYLL